MMAIAMIAAAAVAILAGVSDEACDRRPIDERWIRAYLIGAGVAAFVIGVALLP